MKVLALTALVFVSGMSHFTVANAQTEEVAVAAVTAVAPFYDSVRKIELVLASSDVQHAFHSVQPIKSVRVEDNVVEVEVDTCAVKVELGRVPEAPGVIGATNYQITSISAPVCK